MGAEVVVEVEGGREGVRITRVTILILRRG